MAKRTNTVLNSFRSLAHDVLSGALVTGLLIAASAGVSAQDADGESADMDIEVVEPGDVEVRQADATGEDAGERVILDISEPRAVVIERPEGTGQPVAGTGDAAVGTPSPELTENIVDRVVVNAYGEEVGEISALVVEGDRITHAVLSIGGFLGIGGDEVVVPFDAFDFSGNGEITIETAGTGDQLEDLRPFDPAEFGASDGTSRQEASDETQ